MVPYDRYPHSQESPADRRRRRQLLRRSRWRGRWLALLVISSAMTLSWVGFTRSNLSPSWRSSPRTAALIQSPSRLPGSATAASPRLAPQSKLHYEDWVALLQTEVDSVAAKQLPDLSVLAGDSISLWFPENLLPDDQHWLNQGISGETSEGLQERLEAWHDLRPQRIFVMIGINDLIKGAKAEEVIETNRMIVQQLRQAHPESEIVVQSILPHSGRAATWEGRDKLLRIPVATIQEINQELAAVAREESAEYLDLYPLFSDRDGFLRQELTTDGLHLNPQGYLVWSTALKMFDQTLERALEQSFSGLSESSLNGLGHESSNDSLSDLSNGSINDAVAKMQG